MLDTKTLRLALFGTSRPLLTLGLMAARRDFNLVGICPDGGCAPETSICPNENQTPDTEGPVLTFDTASDDMSDLGAKLPFGVSKHVTTSPACTSAPGTVEPAVNPGCDAKAPSALPELTASETLAQVSTLLLGCPVWHDLEELQQNADLVVSDTDFCQGRPDMSQPQVKAPLWQAVWEYVNQPLTSHNDGGMLTWEQAAALVERLFTQAEKGA